MRFKIASVVLGNVFLASCVWAAEPELDLPDARLEVHEWGVWVRGRTTTGEVLSGPHALIENLPPFVRRHAADYTPVRKNHGWDKPVIHFYGPEGLKLTVKILTPQGHPTAYFPIPKLLESTFSVSDGQEMMVYSKTDCTGLEWTGTLTRQPKGRLSDAPQEHWWQDVRRVPSMYFNADKACENFIFYEATARQEPVLHATVTDDALQIENTYDAPIRQVLLIVSDGSRKYLRAIESIEGKSNWSASKADILKAATDDSAILDAARTQWVSFGMSADESAAIVSAWKPDLLNTPGFLLVSRMPVKLYDRMFPLTVSPLPGKIVRAGVVFDTLPEEAARIKWLPALEATLKAWTKELASDDFEARLRGRARFLRAGDIAKPFLERILADRESDAEVKSSAQALIEGMQPAKGEPVLEPVAGKPNQFIRRRENGGGKSPQAKREARGKSGGVSE